MIEALHVTHQYEGRERPALDDVTIRIPDGEFLAIVGHNGSGKSTFAKHLNGLLIPASGQVLVDGMSTAEEANLLAIRQRVGMVFQNPDNQLVTTIVEEDVAFGPENLGVAPDEIRQRVDAALTTVGMTEYARQAPHLLSGGQKQRIAIAGMLAMNPKVLVLDEATAMLDPRGRQEVLSTVQRLNRETGMTVVMITQYMEEAVLADRVIVMAQGHPVTEGTPRQVFAHAAQLRQLGLDVPAMVRLGDELALTHPGLFPAERPITVKEMADVLCPLLLNR